MQAQSTITIANAANSVDAPVRFVGRQPILDRDRRVFGYELLFRSGLDNWVGLDEESISEQVIDSMLLMGLETVALGAKAFVNCDRQALVDRIITLFPSQSIVIEVLETVAVDDEVVDACKTLKDLGYEIALDDFLPDHGADRLVELADYIKLDFRASSPKALLTMHRKLRRKDLSLLAEKVETEEEFQRAQAEGYAYFQGYFFARPTILKGRDIPAGHLVYIQLLAAVSVSPFDLVEIERLVLAEASLCYRVLRRVNSAASGMRTEISSIRQALLLLGEDQFRKLVTVAAATSLGHANAAPRELMLRALHCARFCELLAPLARQNGSEQYLIGLLSSVDAILRVPMEDVLKMLPLRPDAACALLGGGCPVSGPLRLFQAMERCDRPECAKLGIELHLSESESIAIYIRSLQWATGELGAATL